MATIEERAKSWNVDSARHHFTDMDDWQSGYTQGANEQKQIDIDKACEWLKNDLINVDNDECADMIDSTHYRSVEGLIFAFRKEMLKD